MASSKRISQNTSTSDDNRASKRRQANNPEEPQHPPNRYLPFLTPNDIASHMVPVIRKMLQEELDRRLTQGVGLILNQPAASNRRRLQLCFNNKLPSTIFTQTIIKAEGEKPLQIELRDQQGVVTNESSSSMKIRMCVLDGDFGSNGEEDWTPKEFKDQTVIPREGRGPLLIGDTVIKLENGVGYINKKIVFTDICRTRSRTFRLGLQVVMDPNIIEAAEIKEGRSEPFRVLDHRGEAYKKHERPSLNDEVWRLRGIHKHGKIHEQLLLHGINTVEDFLQLYTTNQGSLQEKIGKTAGKYWKTIITHAKDCDVDDDDKRYIYFATDSPISLVFNCIYEILEVTFDGQNYRSIPSLSSKETRLVERVKQRAYSNLKDLKPFDTTTHGLRKTLTGVQEDEQYGGPDQVPQQFDIPIPQAQQGQAERLPAFSALEEFLPYYSSAGEQVISGPHFGDGEPFPSYLFSPNRWEQVIASPFSSVYGDGAECSNHSSFPHKTVWPKIRIAFKCVMIHVARKKAQVIYQQ